jgi:hypothetical protein
MSATYKRIYTKPSLDKVWFFEQVVANSSNSFSNYIENVSEYITSRVSGLTNFKVLDTITIAELEARKNELQELRPDLYNLIFESTTEDAIDLTIITVIDLIKKYNIPIIMNPFSNTLTEIFEFDSWENLITAYETLVVNDETVIAAIKNDLVIYDNTIAEEFYIDGVKQDYVGKLTS